MKRKVLIAEKDHWVLIIPIEKMVMIHFIPAVTNTSTLRMILCTAAMRRS